MSDEKNDRRPSVLADEAFRKQSVIDMTENVSGEYVVFYSLVDYQRLPCQNQESTQVALKG
jgi:hypothetical protein